LDNDIAEFVDKIAGFASQVQKYWYLGCQLSAVGSDYCHP